MASLAGTSGNSGGGSITFWVYGPGTRPSACPGSTNWTQVGGPVPVSGDGSYSPDAEFTPTQIGDYWWYAVYGGDAGNTAADSACGSGSKDTAVQASETLDRRPQRSGPGTRHRDRFRQYSGHVVGPLRHPPRHDHLLGVPAGVPGHPADKPPWCRWPPGMGTGGDQYRERVQHVLPERRLYAALGRRVLGGDVVRTVARTTNPWIVAAALSCGCRYRRNPFRRCSVPAAAGRLATPPSLSGRPRPTRARTSCVTTPGTAKMRLAPPAQPPRRRNWVLLLGRVALPLNWGPGAQ